MSSKIAHYHGLSIYRAYWTIIQTKYSRNIYMLIMIRARKFPPHILLSIIYPLWHAKNGWWSVVYVVCVYGCLPWLCRECEHCFNYEYKWLQSLNILTGDVLKVLKVLRLNTCAFVCGIFTHPHNMHTPSHRMKEKHYIQTLWYASWYVKLSQPARRGAQTEIYTFDFIGLEN